MKLYYYFLTFAMNLLLVADYGLSEVPWRSAAKKRIHCNALGMHRVMKRVCCSLRQAVEFRTGSDSEEQLSGAELVEIFHTTLTLCTQSGGACTYTSLALSQRSTGLPVFAHLASSRLVSLHHTPGKWVYLNIYKILQGFSVLWIRCFKYIQLTNIMGVNTNVYEWNIILL